MDEQTINTIKALAQAEYESALAWTKDNPPLANSSGAPEERAASMAADAVMYKLGMVEYAKFQSYIGDMDVADWLIARETLEAI